MTIAQKSLVSTKSSGIVLPLHMLRPGETGLVRDIGGDDQLVLRLDEMGLRPGVSVRMVQPGHPCIVAIDHQRLSFRGDEDAVILVDLPHR